MSLYRIILALPFLLCALAGPALAQGGGQQGGGHPPPARQHGTSLTTADIDRLTSLLKDEARRAEFLRTLEALAAASRAQAGAAEGAVPPPAPARPAAPAAQGAEAASPAAAPAPAAPAAEGSADPLIAPNTIGAQLLMDLSGRISALSETLPGAARSIADLPGLWAAAEDMARDPVARARLLDASWKLLLLLGAGLAIEALIARALQGLRWRLDAAAPRDGQVWGWLRRLPLLAGRLLLDLVPVAGFALAVYGLFGLVQPLPTTQLVGLMVAHTYIIARAAFAVAHMLLSPRSKHLRLIPCSDEAAAAWIGWLRRMMLVGVGGYALAEAGLFFGLPWAAYDAIINLTLLAISLFMVRIVLQQRHAVAAVLRAGPLEPGEQPDRTRLMLRRTRDRLAEIWHVLVILWLGAAWIIWALAVENGFQRLLSGTLLTLLVVGLAKALDDGIGRLLDRALHPGPELARRYPGLPARAATYVPVLKLVTSVAIGFGTLVLLLETWGLDALDWFAEGTLGHRLLGTLFSIGCTLLLALVVWEAANSAIQRRLTRISRDARAARSARVRTLLPMLRTMLGVVILVFTVLNALSQLGVNVAPLLAGAGVVGLAVGFGSQTLVRDVITGIFLLLEDAVAVGDSVNVGGKGGVVEHLSIRSIKLRDGDGSIHIVPFSAVTTVTNSTRDFAFAMVDILVAYGTDTDRAGEVLKQIVSEMRTESRWQTAIRDEFDLWGVDSLGQVGIQIRGRVRTEPTQRWPVQRELMRRIKRRFEELGIEIPHQIMTPPPAAADRAGKPAAA